MRFALLFTVVFLAIAISHVNSSKLDFGRSLRSEFLLNSNYINLNHGAYGTYPRAVQADLHKFQARAEGNADMWIRRDARKELNYIRRQLAEVVNADMEDIVVVPNTTSGINAIMRSLVFANGSRILHFSTVYNSMKKIIQYLADYSNGQLTPVEFNATYPITNDELVAAFTEFIDNTPNISLALIDHISSSPAVIVPIERMIPILKAKGILVLIDGAHAVGQIPVDIKALAPDFYITNAHKWLFAARGTAILYVDKKTTRIDSSSTNCISIQSTCQFPRRILVDGDDGLLSIHDSHSCP
jgi:selenocysteine lyase/cysteine desulfurase